MGLENKFIQQHFKKILQPREIKTLSVLVVSEQSSSLDVGYLNKTISELNTAGFTDITIFKLNSEHFIADKNYDVIYVCGGNTFVYLDRIRKSGLDKFIIDSVRNNKSIYVGVSAGSIIVGPSIKTASIGSEGDLNEINLKLLLGLQLVDFLIFPHFTNKDLTNIKDLEKRTALPVLRLADNEAVFIKSAQTATLKDIYDKVKVS